jgi:hypothetical protein
MGHLEKSEFSTMGIAPAADKLLVRVATEDLGISLRVGLYDIQSLVQPSTSNIIFLCENLDI